MMGLFKRFNDIVSANLNDLIDRFEDPEKGLKQAIREMEESIQTATAETTKVLANQKRLEKEVARNASDVQKWHALAEQSVDASDDDAARNALGKVAEYGTLLESLNQQLSSATGASDVLKEQLSGMRAKMEEAKRSLATLSARQKAADIRKQAISSTNRMGSLYHTSLPSAFSAGVRGVDHGGRVCGGDVGGFPLAEPELHSNDGRSFMP
jgi:phage shock protein A